MLRTLKKRGKHLNRRTLAYFSLLGLTGIALSMPILQLSILYAGSGVAAVLFSCNPGFVTFLAFSCWGSPSVPGISRRCCWRSRALWPSSAPGTPGSA